MPHYGHDCGDFGSLRKPPLASPRIKKRPTVCPAHVDSAPPALVKPLDYSVAGSRPVQEVGQLVEESL